ncbi:hypothetical protein SAMN05660199_01380 [Klenkia soli]|uniref:Uncharacterized protein n=2 Tax=Klenkia soli TaxID=1052260 RepID=A0A1H0H8K9_9ACTN|nr:hypothetical protein SAMN05660199_01380 [Klenkia soli]
MRGRRRGATDPGTAPPAGPVEAVEAVDDLPGFYDSPPGSPAALTAAPPPVEQREAPAGDPDSAPTDPRRRRWVAAAAAAVVLVGAATTVAVVAGQGTDHAQGGGTDTTADRTSASATSSTSSRPAASTSPAAPLTAAAAGDLAGVELSPGGDGFTAALTWTGVVLEPRAVGVTVAYPQLTVSSDGTQAVAHLELAVWNCLADTPPADPATADCRRSLTEYADLGSPDLQVTRTADGVELVGTFATYTRPNGSPEAYTGRSYPVEIGITRTADGASGTLGLGSGEATVVPPGQLDD